MLQGERNLLSYAGRTTAMAARGPKPIKSEVGCEAKGDPLNIPRDLFN
jgi:hypothetical protein